MNKLKIYLYIIYFTAAILLLALASCASDDIVTNNAGQQGERMSLGIQVLQAQDGLDAKQAQDVPDAQSTRCTAAPAIKSYRWKTDGKPVFAQVSSEAYIGKHVSVESGDADRESRGVSITSDTFYDRFGLFYYEYGKNETWQDIVAAGTMSPTVSNFAVEKSAGWLTDKYWPGADHKLTFMAYAPYDNDYKNGSSKYIQLSSSIKGYPTLTYTVPAKVEDQKDLLVSAESNTQDMEGDYNKVIGMKFYHALSAINFKIGSVMAPGRISKIEVRGIRNKGNYDFGTREWTGQSGTANYSIAPNYVIADQRGVVFTGVDDSKNDLMLVMPQTVPSGAKIVVTIQDGANYSISHEMELPIEGHEWPAGYTITYSLSTSQENGDYILSVSKVNSIDKGATNVSYKVSSYVQSYYGAQTPVGWTAEYAVDDDIDAENYTSEYGEVLTGGFPFSLATPTATTTSLTANIAALEPPVSDPASNTHTDLLRKATPLGTENNPYDLSTLGGTQAQSTANCYVIHAPGWYKLPLVYGNSIKNGNFNTAVYGSDKPTYKNHLNNVITAAWLKDNSGVVPAEGMVTWQDAYKLIEPDSVSVSSDGKYLIFKVNKDKICQGNALLSVRDAAGIILWSWHIWVTDKEFSASTDIAVTNYQRSVYKFMALPLGFCDADKRVYAPRKISFRFVQDESGNTAEVTFDQSTTSTQSYGLNAPFYQYGRSMPLFLGTGLANAWKTLYFADGMKHDNANARVTTGVSIQHPCRGYYVDKVGDWNSTVYNDLWDVSNTKRAFYDKGTQLSVKTIYDPCPVGYKVPEPGAFTGFTTTGGEQTTASKFNVLGSYNRGWNFYTQPNKSGEGTIFFHALGYVNWQLGLTEIGTGNIGEYITTGAGSYTSGSTTLQTKFQMLFSKTYVKPRDASSRRCAPRNVRPVVDE